jgi:phage gpG-like protein
MITAKLDDKEVIDWMNKLYKRSGNLKGFFVHTAIPVIHNSIMKNFRVGGRPQRWESLRPLTLANRMAHGSMSGHALGQSILIGRGMAGGLQGSIGTVRRITKSTLEYGTNAIHASTHQYGRTIRPVNVRFLTIPLPAARPGSKARDYDNTFVAKGIIFQKQGANIVPLFKLKKSVKIPARPFMLFQNEDIKEMGKNLLVFIAQPERYKKVLLKGR